MTKADEIMARVLHRTLRPLDQMPPGESALCEALRRARPHTKRYEAILEQLCTERRRTNRVDPPRPLQGFTNEELLSELLVYRLTFTDFERQLLSILTSSLKLLTEKKR